MHDSENSVVQNLLSRFKNNDRKAYLDIYDRFSPGLFQYAASRLKNANDAEDLVHDVFLKAWNNKSHIESIGPYLYGLMRYRIIDHIRRQSTKGNYELSQGSIIQTVDLEEELNLRELQRFIDNTVEQFSPRMREIYLLSRRDNLDLDQIAEQLNISKQTVKNQLSLALKNLRAALDGTHIPLILAIIYLLHR